GNLLRLLPRGERRHQYKRAQPTNGGHYEAARKTRFHRVSPDGIGWNDLKTAATIPRPLTFTLSVFWVFSDAPFAAPFSFFQRWDITKAGAFNGESLALLTAPASPPPSCAPDPLRPSRAALCPAPSLSGLLLFCPSPDTSAQAGNAHPAARDPVFPPAATPEALRRIS